MTDNTTHTREESTDDEQIERVDPSVRWVDYENHEGTDV